jgi:hypothetical protein
MDDSDVWQHLAVGRAIWNDREIPRTHLWSWPTYGTPEVLPSWGFRALLWPFWSWGGVWGLQVWRWITTLVAFAFLAAAARRMGARGFAPLVVLVIAALVYRDRSQPRPETLVAVLLAIEIWILETRRQAGRRDLSLWLVPLAWVWANVHISYYLGLVLIGIHLGSAWIASWRERRPGRRSGRGAMRTRGGGRSTEADESTAVGADARSVRRLAIVAAAAIAVSFLNPFGWRALAQPLEYFLHWRHEPIYQTIIELAPVNWKAEWRTGLPLLVLGWPALIIARAARRRFDLAEALTWALFTALVFAGHRFVGFYALAAAPYIGRGLSGWAPSIRWPSWSRTPATRAIAVSLVCVGASLPNWLRPAYPLGVGFQWPWYPVRACDFMAAEGVSGRGFNQYYIAGYQLWRFWPDRERLPFMDIHQSGTREIRRLYAHAFGSQDAWAELERGHRFDYALLDGHQSSVRGDRLLDFLDGDSTWALVFRDDAAALFVRRQGPLAAVARRHGFGFAPGGDQKTGWLERFYRDRPDLRPLIRAETDRQIASSPWNARARMLKATLEWIDGQAPAAERELRAALRVEPTTLGAHRRLGLIAMRAGRTEDAVREFEAERDLGYGPMDLNGMIAQAHMSARDWKRAERALRRELRVNPGNVAARESLDVVSRRLAGAPD